MLPNYKEITGLIKKGATLEAQEKIMELREAAINLQDENHDLRGEIRGLESELKIRAGLEYESPYYWLVDGENRDGPFCQLCYDKDQKLIRLQQRKWGGWFCHSCEGVFFDSSYGNSIENPSPRRRHEAAREKYYK